MAALAIGTILAVAVYGGGYISGGHYNPAVTFAALLCGKIDIANSIVNTAAQIGGSFGAAIFAIFLEGEGKIGYPAVGEDFEMSQAILSEAVCTCFLCLVVLGSACSASNAGKDFYGYAIGMTVFSCAISSGRVSGGAFNPAVGLLGAADNSFGDLPVYIVGPYVGAILAAIIFRLVSPSDVPSGKSFLSNWTILARDTEGFTLTNKCVAELMGTFFLTYTVAMCDGSHHFSAFAIGTSLATSIYGLGFVSGGHFNPAVSVGIFVHKLTKLDGDNSPKDLLFYIISQVFGACLAVGIANYISDLGIGMPAPGHYSKHETYSIIAVLAVEILATGTLIYTVLNCCFSSQAGNNYYGFAIGAVVFVMASAVGPISGGGFNPAVCIATLGVNHALANLWIYCLAPCVGGALAAGTR